MPSSPFADVTAAQYDVLLAIAHADAPTHTDVIEAYQRRRETMSKPTAYLTHLVQQGYVSEDRSEDSSTTRYQLSAKGRNTLWTLREELDAALEEHEQ